MQAMLVGTTSSARPPLIQRHRQLAAERCQYKLFLLPKATAAHNHTLGHTASKRAATIHANSFAVAAAVLDTCTMILLPL
jgi:hypothetical protein